MVFKMFKIGMFYSAIKKLVLLRKQALNLARQGRGQVFWAHLSEDVRSNEWSSRSRGSKIKTSGICSMKMMFTVSRMHPIQSRKPISLIDVLKIDSKPTKSINHHQSHWCFTTRKKGYSKLYHSYTIVIPCYTPEQEWGRTSQPPTPKRAWTEPSSCDSLVPSMPEGIDVRMGTLNIT